MNKSEWQELYRELHQNFQQYSLEQPQINNGSNKQKRTSAKNTCLSCIQVAKSIIMYNPEALDLWNEGKNIFKQNESFTLQWFNSDMSRFLEKLEQKINNL